MLSVSAGASASMPSTVMPSAILPRMSCRPGHSDASWRARSRTAGVSSSSRQGGRLEVADLLDLIAPELDPQGMLVRRREHVEQTAPDGDLTATLDQIHPRIADLDQMRDGV